MKSKLKLQIILAKEVVHIARKSKDDADNVISALSVAVNNIQVAANAIVDLAADVGAMNSIATNADISPEIRNNISRANKNVKAAAYLAEKTSAYAMHVSIQSVESTTGNVVTLAEKVLDALRVLKEEDGPDRSKVNLSLKSLDQGALTASESARTTDNDVSELLDRVQNVLESVKESRVQVILVVDCISNEKLSNLLISKELLEASSAACKDAEAASSLIAIACASMRRAHAASSCAKGLADVLQADIDDLAYGLS